MEISWPQPLPDNPLKWDGWRLFDAPNPYDRLCLVADQSPTDLEIEEHCRQLLVWWQKKLPLKNQPSNPITQILRGGLDDAAQRLVEARTILLNPERRAEVDARLLAEQKEKASEEFEKFFAFATLSGTLRAEEEKNLYEVGEGLSLSDEEVAALIEDRLAVSGIAREEKEAQSSPLASAQSPDQEFRKLLRLTNLTEDDLTDDQRDALCNMGESLGLTGGQAEDLIDEYLEWMQTKTVPSAVAPLRSPLTASVALKKTPEVSVAAKTTQSLDRKQFIDVSPTAQKHERERFRDFKNSLGMEMRFLPSGAFTMGCEKSDAAPDESPISKVTVSGFFMARFPVTNAQYERCDSAHRLKRAPWADETHPVVYVTHAEAERFCEWLSRNEPRKYRLPTEAEWEYAACGGEARIFPWGNLPNQGDLANFADCNTTFPWADSSVDTGFAQTAPVGKFPNGASPFGIEELAGNVWEWCADGYASYKPQEKTNPRPQNGVKRVYRGGSWKSRAGNLRTTARGGNLADYSSNDVGFRVICEAI